MTATIILPVSGYLFQHMSRCLSHRHRKPGRWLLLNVSLTRPRDPRFTELGAPRLTPKCFPVDHIFNTTPHCGGIRPRYTLHNVIRAVFLKQAFFQPFFDVLWHLHAWVVNRASICCVLQLKVHSIVHSHGALSKQLGFSCHFLDTFSSI